MASIARLSLERFRFVGSLIRESLRPALYVWPWIAGVAIFAFFLDSPQGKALSEAFAEQPADTELIFTLVFWTGALVGMAALLAQVSAAAFQKTALAPTARILVAGVWVAALTPAFGAALALETNSGEVWYATVGVAMFCLIALTWAIYSARNHEAASSRAIRFVHRHRLLLSSVVVVVTLVPLVGGAMVVTTRPADLANLGPLLVGMVGIAALSSLFATWFVVVPVCLNTPWLGVLAFVAIFTWTASRPVIVEEDNPLLREQRDAAVQKHRDEKSCKTTPSNLGEAVEDHVNLAQHDEGLLLGKKVYLVSAEGGGIRAAYWTALALGQMDIATRGKFRDRVATLSGVSGGSLGIATWLAAQERQDLSPDARLQTMKRFLGSDFLSPLLGGFLFLDVPRLLLGPVWFQARRDQVFEKALADQWMRVGETDFFARPYFQLCLSSFEKVPAVYLNATDAMSGKYVPLTTATLPSGTFWDDLIVSDANETTLANATVAQVVHISARFPYLSPAADVGVEASVLANERRLVKEASIHPSVAAVDLPDASSNLHSERLVSRIAVLIDGGYVDNTGLTPTMEALAHIAQEREGERASKAKNRPTPYTNVAIEAMHIANDPGKACFPVRGQKDKGLGPLAKRFVETTKQHIRCESDARLLDESFRSNPFGWLTTPLASIIAVRESHSAQTKAILRVAAEDLKPTEANVVTYSLSDELSSLVGPESEQLSFSKTLFNTRNMNRRLAADGLEMADFDKRSGILSQMEFERYEREVNDFLTLSEASFEGVTCGTNVPPTAPPLGWTLTRQNRNVTDCLWHRAAVKRGIAVPVFRVPKEPTLKQ